MSSQNRTRNVRIEFRCTPEESQIINEKAAAAGMNRTDFLIKSLSEKEIVIHKNLAETLSELRRQGINLNQALRLAKANIDFEKLKIAIQNCNELYEKYLIAWKNEEGK